MTLAFAHHLAGALARARGDLAGAAAHLAAQSHAVGPGPNPPASYAIDAEAELALWERRPEAALPAAEEGLRLQVEDPLRWMLIAALGARAAADLAELARARRDAAAETAARERATALSRRRARPRRRRRASRAGRDDRGRTRARRRRQRSGAVGRGRARLGGAAGAVPGRLRALAPGRGGPGAARPRPGGARAARRARHRRRASARRPCRQSSKPWRAARGSRCRPPPRSRRPRSRPRAQDLGLTARELEVLAAPRARRDQPPDRRRALHQRAHRRRPRLAHPRQAQRRQPRRGGRDRPPARLAPASDHPLRASSALWTSLSHLLAWTEPVHLTDRWSANRGRQLASL